MYKVQHSYVKSFEGENFHSFHKFLLTANVSTLKIFFEYWRCPPTTQALYHLVLSSQLQKFSQHIKF